MSERKVGTVAKKLIEAKRRIENPENWCRGTFVDSQGRMCARGALGDRINFRASEKAIKTLYLAANDLYGYGCGVVEVNDFHGHTAVMKMYDRAISIALSEGE